MLFHNPTLSRPLILPGVEAFSKQDVWDSTQSLVWVSQNLSVNQGGLASVNPPSFVKNPLTRWSFFNTVQYRVLLGP